ncbi:hypothetical protein Tco_0371432 [Tanacetum coccineum]
MRGDDIQSFYTNWEDNGCFDHCGESMATYDQGSSYNGDFVSGFDQTSSNNLNLHLHAQGDSPLGLTLRKSNSLLNLVEMRLSQEREQKKVESQPTREKLKASNFHALVLQIGSWKRVSKNEGDLVAKVYYAKKKLVWEFLDGPLKNKIEIQWSEISAIRAFTYEGEHGQLEIELNQQPQFGRETNPQPRKHTQWKQTSDFTGGQASICRRHVIVFPPGVLDRQYEKLLQCDSRLLSLSQQPFPVNNYPYFNYDPNHCLNFSNTYVNHPQIFDDHDPNSPMSVMRFPYSNERTRRHTNENQERVHSHFEGISAITYGLQDHVPPCYGQQESWIPSQQSQTKALHEELQSTGYRNNETADLDQLRANSSIGIQEPSSWQGLPDLYGHQWEQGVNHHYDTYWT